MKLEPAPVEGPNTAAKHLQGDVLDLGFVGVVLAHDTVDEVELLLTDAGIVLTPLRLMTILLALLAHVHAVFGGIRHEADGLHFIVHGFLEHPVKLAALFRRLRDVR